MDSGTSDTPAPEKIYDVPAEWSKRAFIGEARYHDMYACSVSDPNRFRRLLARQPSSIAECM